MTRPVSLSLGQNDGHVLQNTLRQVNKGTNERVYFRSFIFQP